MKKPNRRGTLLLIAGLMLGIALIAFLSTIPAKINAHRGLDAARPIFDAQAIDSITLVDTYLGSDYGVSSPRPSPADNWPFVRITDKTIIADLCTQVLNATREQVRYMPYVHDDKYNAYWELILNDTQIVRLTYDSGGHGLRPSCTMIYEGICWDMDRPATKVLYDTLDAHVAPKASADIASATLSSLADGKPVQTVSLTSDALDPVRQVVDSFLTEAEETVGIQTSVLLERATLQLSITYADGTGMNLTYIPWSMGGGGVLTAWRANSAFLGSKMDCYRITTENDPFPALFSLFEH